MTLVITVQANSGLVQCSDRLVVTRARGRPDKQYDDRANKAIILFTIDSVAVIGFAGIAYIDGISTGRWITKVIAGDRPEIVSSHAIMQNFSKITRSKISNVIHDLELRLQGARMKVCNLHISIVGYRFRRNFYHPFSYYIRVPKAEAPQHLRRYYYDGMKVGIAHIGAELQNSQLGDAFDKHIKQLPPQYDSVRDALVDVIRSVSKTTSSVGDDVMSIRMDVPSRSIDIRFISDRSWEADDLLGVVDMGFTPAVVTPIGISQPHRIASDSTLTIGNWRLEIKGPDGDKPPGLIALWDCITETPPEP